MAKVNINIASWWIWILPKPNCPTHFWSLKSCGNLYWFVFSRIKLVIEFCVIPLSFNERADCNIELVLFSKLITTAPQQDGTESQSPLLEHCHTCHRMSTKYSGLFFQWSGQQQDEIVRPECLYISSMASQFVSCNCVCTITFFPSTQNLCYMCVQNTEFQTTLYKVILSSSVVPSFTDMASFTVQFLHGVLGFLATTCFLQIARIDDDKC